MSEEASYPLVSLPRQDPGGSLRSQGPWARAGDCEPKEGLSLRGGFSGTRPRPASTERQKHRQRHRQTDRGSNGGEGLDSVGLW